MTISRLFFPIKSTTILYRCLLRGMVSLAPIDVPPENTYVWQEGVEDLEQYTTGGYHPVHIDDEIQNRYRIVHKLGFGTYSTVWLARDQRKDRFVALKLIVASASVNPSEMQILRHINEQRPSHPCRQYISTLLDDFEITGPNGTHRCIVSDVGGSSVGQVKNESIGGKIPVKIARQVVSKSCKGLAFLHSCGIVHGDFHLNNILLSISGFDSWPTEKVYEYFGKPRKVPVVRVDRQLLTPAAPRYTVKPPNPVRLAQTIFELGECDIKITDFGESFLMSDPKVPKTLNTPTSLAPPEVLFEGIISPKVDVWTLACTIFWTLGNHDLFESFFKDRDEVITEIVRTLGKLPEPYWSQWENRSKFFEDDGSFILDSGDMSGPPRTVKLKERLIDLRRDDDVGQRELQDDLPGLEAVLSKMLRYNPEERIDIQDVVLPF